MISFDPLYSLAFTTGLLGSGHCIGMCGGLVSALGLHANGRHAGFGFHLLYNLGRTLSYTLIGLSVGWLGSTLLYSHQLLDLGRYLLIGTDLLIIFAGLGTAGLFSRLSLSRLEFAAPLQFLSRGSARLQQLPSAVKALPLGMMFGFLPCGFLYAMFLMAAQSASALHGALIMLAFGLGTLPGLFFIGTTASLLTRTRRMWLLRFAGIGAALMGSWNLLHHLGFMAQGGAGG
jgi:sulfite exporter TauE/SafE